MSFKLDDFKCNDCGEVSELLLKNDEKPVCPHCNSENMEKQLSTGSGNHVHVSWSKWRA